MKITTLVAGLILATGSTAFAAGFEKSIMWGGQTSGVAGIATPYISGATSTYFNPAGLAGSDAGTNDVSLNVSLAQSQFKAPIGNTSTQESSNSHLSTSGGLMYSRSITSDLGIGVGYYASGGSYVDYTGTTKTNNTGTAIQGNFESKTDLQVTEAALGVGYKLMENLKLGFAYRVVMAKASLSTIKAVAPTTNNAFAQVGLNDLKANNYTAFKLGAQYKLGKTDLGFTYRSEATFKAKGTMTTQVHTIASPGTETSTDVTAGTLFPASWTLGMKHACTDTWNSYAEYNYTEYSKVDNISTETSAGSNPIVLKMKDQHLIRLAAEYTGYALPIRFGYIFGTQVTNSDADKALPTSTPPGVAHVLTLGTGYGKGSWRADGGFEMNMVKGTASGNTAANEANAYALHLGGSYTF